MARKSLIYFFIFLFTLQVGGFVFLFKAVQYYVRIDAQRELKSNMPDTYYSYFNFSEIKADASFRWEESNKEFWYKGNIYDILKIEKSGILKCLSDTVEKKLFQRLDAQTNILFEKSPKAKSSLKIINSLLASIYLPTGGVKIPTNFNVIIRTVYYYDFKENPLVLIAKNDEPPQIS